MKRVCAWCGLVMDPGTRDGSTQPVSHGICERCRAEVQATIPIPLDRFLDALDVPAVLVDEEQTIGAIGRHVADDRHDGSAHGRKVGEVFLCAHAEDHDCGLSIHCSGCTIRQCVHHTFRTGEPREDVPATLVRTDHPQPEDVALLVSTTRVGTRVLLRLQEVDDS